MNAEDIYAKTEKAVQELAQRRGELSYRQRRVLILVSGQQTITELQKKSGLPMAEVMETLSFLVTQEYVQLVPRLTPKHLAKLEDLATVYQQQQSVQSEPSEVPAPNLTPSEDQSLDFAVPMAPQNGYWVETDARPVRSLEAAKLLMRELLEQHLPEKAMIQALRVEKCVNTAQLLDYLDECKPLVKKARGKTVAQDFVVAIKALLPNNQ